MEPYIVLANSGSDQNWVARIVTAWNYADAVNRFVADPSNTRRFPSGKVERLIPIAVSAGRADEMGKAFLPVVAEYRVGSGMWPVERTSE